MNASDQKPVPTALAADTSASPEGDTAAASKPKRRRSPRKLGDPVAADGSAAAPADQGAPTEASAETAPRPKARRAANRAPTANEVFGQAAESASLPAAAHAQAGAGDSAAVQVPAATQALVSVAEQSLPAAETYERGPNDAGGSAAGAEGPRRSRNRRRGRRGGDRLRAEGEEAGADAGPHDRAPAGPPRGEPARIEQPDAVEVFAQVLAGEFDAEAPVELPADAAADDAAPQSAMPAAPAEAVSEPAAGTDQPAQALTAEAGTQQAAEPNKRVLAPEADAPKLHKVLAQSGVGSRRDLEQMIGEGRFTVNGELAHIGQRISFGDRIQLDGKPVRYRIAPPPPRVLAYHKPAGEVVSHDDPQQRPTVFRRLPHLAHGKWQSVGRLDINTEGLLLFTTSGELANQLMHPRFGVEREYAVRSLGVLEPEAKARLLDGVEIDGQRAAFKSIDDGGGEGVNHWYRVVITEGRNREVRRLFEAVGHAVSRLIRIRYGSVVLPRGLKRGVWVDLTDHDLRNLRRLASGPRPAEGAGAPRPPGAGPAAPGGGNKRGRNRRNGRPEGAERNMDGPQDRPQERPLARPQDRPAGGRTERAPERGADRQPGPMRNGNGNGNGNGNSNGNVNGNRNGDRNGNRNGGPRPDRGPRADRGQPQDRPPRAPRGEVGEGGAIPNPLQQTFDKRALQAERRTRHDMPEDGPIPNPLQQTFDKRALQRDRLPQRDLPEDGPIPNPLQQTYDKRAAQIAKAGRKADAPDPEHIPDPMQTSVGYIGADAFRRKSGGGGRGGRRTGAKSGGGGGFGGGGGGGGGGGAGAGGGAGGPARNRSRGPRGGRSR